MPKYFWYSIGGAILGTTIAIAGFVKNYYETGNIPSIVPLEGHNQAISLTGVALIAASGIVPMALNIRNKRRKQELESISDSNSNQEFDGINPPYLP